MSIIPLLGHCEDDWKKNGSRCFLPVYDRMSFFGAFAHCNRLNSTLYSGHFLKVLFFNASQNIVSSRFWTGKLYNIDPRAKWIWLNGSVFEEWDNWKIIITDVGCNGCGFWKNGTIYLTSKCSQHISYLCQNDHHSKF